LDKNEIAALLESLCERPFAADQEEPAIAARASRIAQALSSADAERSGSTDQSGSGEAPNSGADLAALLSGGATEAQCRTLHEAAVTSGPTRLEAQSALAFIDDIEQAPLAAPAHLVGQAVASAGGARSRARAGAWSNWSGFSGRRAAAAFAVMLVATGLSWSLLRQPADVGPERSAVPTAIAPKEALPIGAINPAPDVTPPPAPPAPEPVAPAAELAPAPSLAPPLPAPAAVQALAEPCTPRGAGNSEARAASDVRFRVVKPAPKPPQKTAGLDTPDAGCLDTGNRLVVNPAAESGPGGNQKADRGPVRAERPPAQVGRSDRAPAAAAASTPAAVPYSGAARSASPALRPSTVQPAR
jgi:hypothetical protein